MGGGLPEGRSRIYFGEDREHVLDPAHSALYFMFFSLLQDLGFFFRLHEELVVEISLLPSSVNESQDKPKNKIETPVSAQEVEANVVSEVGEAELGESEEHVVVGFPDDSKACFEEHHEVSHVVAPALDQ